MECDAVVALARATVDGQTRFGQRSKAPAGQSLRLRRTPGRTGAPDEKLRTPFVELPQARQIYAVLACQLKGSWGYEFGVNEHQVAVGWLALKPTLTCETPGLLGPDLARLLLERSRTSCQAVDLLTGLVERFGQGTFPGCPAEAACDSAFLVADPKEAYAVETAGHYWVYQEIQEIRAVSNVRVIRQDWDRIAQGLASYAISRGWWAGDGSKLDFAGALGEDLSDREPAMRRWGRATVRLMEENGHIETAFVRQLVSDDSAAGFVVSLTSDPGRLPLVWYSVGTAGVPIYFPLFLDGELPAVFSHAGPKSGGEVLARRLSHLGAQLERIPARRAQVCEAFVHLQACFDHEAEEWSAEGAALKQRGALADLQRQATSLMQYNVERFEEVLADVQRVRTLVAVNG